ncbi:Hypothetical protein I595_987 [Croceitalea dokdonensis DOKDO 023]|uniref:Uncharacterized protein n=1 Tax=Croceitalea dokdonensis DOKDO 023 TaxID=1300341 RepID=A0A0P7B0U5_9FLAO|nr:Hypothetical protein I595_987 [Croceitalea dokdonensis DOKDO 023]
MVFFFLFPAKEEAQSLEAIGFMDFIKINKPCDSALQQVSRKPVWLKGFVGKRILGAV